MCPNRDWFLTYETISKDAVLIGSDASCKVAYVFIIRIKFFDRTIIMLAYAKHALDLKRNLISLSTLDSKGYKYIGEGGALKVSKGPLAVMKGHKIIVN